MGVNGVQRRQSEEFYLVSLFFFLFIMLLYILYLLFLLFEYPNQQKWNTSTTHHIKQRGRGATVRAHHHIEGTLYGGESQGEQWTRGGVNTGSQDTEDGP